MKDDRKTNKTQGEWTADWLANFGKADNWLESICDAHNAALDAAIAEEVESYKASIGALQLSNEGKRQQFNDLYDSVIEAIPQEFRQNSKGAVGGRGG